jgi:hypothetical protein
MNDIRPGQLDMDIGHGQLRIVLVSFIGRCEITFCWLMTVAFFGFGAFFAVAMIIAFAITNKETCAQNCVDIPCYIQMTNYIGKCTCSYIINNSTIKTCQDYDKGPMVINEPFNVL